MVFTTFPTTKQNQGSTLRIYINGGALVEDTCQFLNVLEKAYNSAYVFNAMVDEAQEIANFYEGQRPPIPLKNLLWMNWLPLNAEKIKSFLPKSERLKLVGSEFHSRGFIDIFGASESLEVIRKTIDDVRRWKQVKGKLELENEKLQIENELAKLKVVEKKIEILKKLDFSEKQVAVLAESLIIEPQKQFNQYQDQNIVEGADFVDSDGQDIDT